MLNFEIKIELKKHIYKISTKRPSYSQALVETRVLGWMLIGTALTNERCFQSCSAYGQHNQLIDSAFPSVNFKNSKLSMYIDSDWAKYPPPSLFLILSPYTYWTKHLKLYDLKIISYNNIRVYH